MGLDDSGVEIKFDDRSAGVEYSMEQNTVYINKNLAETALENKAEMFGKLAEALIKTRIGIEKLRTEGVQDKQTPNNPMFRTEQGKYLLYYANEIKPGKEEFNSNIKVSDIVDAYKNCVGGENEVYNVKLSQTEFFPEDVEKMANMSREEARDYTMKLISEKKNIQGCAHQRTLFI